MAAPVVGTTAETPLDPLRKPIIYEAEFTSVTNRRTLTARWVFPVSGPPLANGVVTIRGDKIEAVEPPASARRMTISAMSRSFRAW